MKLTKALIASSALALATLSPLAHAGFIGDTATLTFNQRAFSTPANFGAGSVVGAGTEFSATGRDVFGQIWTLNADVFDNGVTFSWSESTRTNNSGNISAGANAFGFDLSFTSALVSQLTLVSSVGASATASRVVTSLNGPQSLHIGFDHFNSGESYTFVTAVPEPGTTALMFLGLGMLGYSARRRNANKH